MGKNSHFSGQPLFGQVMNMLAAMGAYCFFGTKPEVNSDFEVSESYGQLVIWKSLLSGKRLLISGIIYIGIYKPVCKSVD